MQKKLIALAVAGLVSGAAFAQTNVTIYGAADGTFEMVQAKGATANNVDLKNFTRVSSNSSILGFRGNEDLGGGLKAIFQFESGIDLDSTRADGGNAGARLFNRDTFVGLQGGFGQIKAGIITGPARSLGAAVDLTVGATGIGANTAMLGKLGGDAGRAFSYWDTRRSNSIQYVTPKFGGFEVRAMYGAGEGRGPDGLRNDKAGKTYELGGFYNNGPWYAGLTYGETKPEYDWSVTNSVGIVGGAPAVVQNATSASGISANSNLIGVAKKRSVIRFGGTYTFQAGHKIAVLLEQNKASDVGGRPALPGFAAVDGPDWKSNTIGLGGKFKVSQPGAIIAQVYHVTKLKGVRSTATVSANDYKATFFALGYEHALSKRTTLKAYYSRINNKEQALYNYGIGNISGAAVGSNPTGFALGVRHSF